MKGRIFLDTNVLVYLFDRGAPAKRHRTQEILEREAPAGRLAVSTQGSRECDFISRARPAGQSFGSMNPGRGETPGEAT